MVLAGERVAYVPLGLITLRASYLLGGWQGCRWVCLWLAVSLEIPGSRNCHHACGMGSRNPYFVTVKMVYWWWGSLTPCITQQGSAGNHAEFLGRGVALHCCFLAFSSSKRG